MPMKIISICKLYESCSGQVADPRTRLTVGGLNTEHWLRDNIADLVKVELYWYWGSHLTLVSLRQRRIYLDINLVVKSLYGIHGVITISLIVARVDCCQVWVSPSLSHYSVSLQVWLSVSLAFIIKLISRCSELTFPVRLTLDLIY